MSDAAPILIIEDNQDAADTLAALLEIVGYRPVIASDGEAGVREALAHPPAAILCDIGLPGISGYEVARRLRNERDFAALPIVAMTGYSQYADRQEALQAGFDEHMPKPVDVEKLIGFLAQRLAGHEPRHGA